MGAEAADGPNCRAHLERHLGTPEAVDHVALGSLHILRFRDQPLRGAITYATEGVATIAGDSADERQELVFSCYRRHDHASIRLIIGYLAGSLALRTEGARRGEILEIPFVPDKIGQFKALWALDPQFFPPSFWRDDASETELRALFPLFEAEVAFADQHGIGELERLMVEADADFLDLKRRPIRLPK